MSDKKQVLIVTGVARSGTTALAELLNSHEQICVGIERFKFQYLRAHSYDPAFYERDRFFDFRDEDTNLRPDVRPAWQPTYDAIAAKWDGAAVIGDKVPDMTSILGEFMTRNPDFRYIFILRNLKDVALSWHARASRTRDSWPKGKNFAVACESWGQQMQQLLDLVGAPDIQDRLLILDYDRMFEESAANELAITRFLGVGPSEAMRATFDRHVAFIKEKKTKKVPPPHVESYKAVDMTAFQALRRKSRLQVERLSAPVSE